MHAVKVSTGGGSIVVSHVVATTQKNKMKTKMLPKYPDWKLK